MVEKNIAQLGKMIRELRPTNDIKSVEFAKDIGVSQSYISDLENGKKKRPRMEILEKIANYFGGTDEGMVKYLYIQFLELAGYIAERNSIVHQIPKRPEKEILPLSELIKSLDEEEKKPIQNKEFILNYKNSDDTITTVRSILRNDEDIFDINTMLQNEFKAVTSLSKGVTSYGNTPLYYCGKKLTHEDRIKAMKLLDIVFDIDREEYNKNK